MPTRKAVTAAFHELAHEHLDEFQYQLKNEILALGGAITIDVVNLTVQNKHYYDFTLHYAKNERSNVLCGTSKVGICNQTIVLIDSPSVPSAENLSSAIDNALEENYRVPMRSL